MNYGKVSAEYNINAFNTIGVNLSLFRLYNPVNTTSNSYANDATPANNEFYITHRDLKPQDENYLQSVAPGFTYRHVFIVPKHTLDIDATASDFNRYANSVATDHYILLNNATSNQTNASDAHLRMYNVQADYTNPIKEGYTLDAGYKFNVFDLDLVNNIYNTPIGGGDYTKDNQKSSVTKTITSENDVYVSMSGNTSAWISRAVCGANMRRKIYR